MTFYSFFRDVFLSRPLFALFISGLFFLAGILELVSMALVLPVFMQLLGGSQDAGIAANLIGFIGFSDVSLPEALFFISLLMVFRGILMLLADFAMAKLARDLEIEVRVSLYSSFVKSTWSYILSQDLGRMPNIILREPEKYSIAVQKLGQFLSALFISAVLIGSSILVSWQLLLLFSVAVLPYFILTRFLNKRVLNHSQKRLMNANKLSSHISESLMHLKYIKASSLEKSEIDRFSSRVKGYANHFFKIICYMRFIKNFPEIFGIVIISGLVILAHESLGDKPADIIFFLLLMFRGYRQISGLQTILSSLIENIPSYEMCQKFIKECVEKVERLKGDDLQGQIHLKVKDVSFGYDNAQDLVLKSVNLDLPVKGLVAFAGASGAGKTTLVDILLGLYPQKSGEISVSERGSLSNIDVSQWRKSIGYVPQEPFLISGSIKDNILIHSEDKSEENLLSAAKKAKVDHFVEEFPDGFNTNVGLINTGLSGGQKQRIALARALAHETNILILDEATSALDAQTAQDIKEALLEISKQKLVVIIAHSADMLKAADLIYTLDKGEVKEQGNYENLMSNRGALWELFKKTGSADVN